MNIPKEYLFRTAAFSLEKQGIASDEAKRKFELVQSSEFGSYPAIEILDLDVSNFLEPSVLENCWVELESIIRAEESLRSEAEVNAAVVMTALDDLIPDLSSQQISYALAYVFRNLPN